MKPRTARILQIISIAFSGILFLGFSYLALTGYISDSEIWSVTVAKHLGEEWFNPWVYTRPLFYAALAIAEAPFQEAIPIFMAAKVVCLGNAFLITFFSFRLARRICQDGGKTAAIIPWLAVIFILANSGFMNQGYRIRSDLFSTWLMLFALERTFRVYEKHPPKSFLYWLLPFLATPKAAIHVLPAIALPKSRKARQQLLSLILLCGLVIFIVYPESVTFFLNTYTDPELKKPFFSSDRFIYIKRALVNNGLFVLIFALRLITLEIRIKTGSFSSELQKSVHLGFKYFVYGSLLLLVLSPEKVPFYLASFIPLLAVFASLLLEDIEMLLPKIGSQTRQRYYWSLFSASIFLALFAMASNAAINWNAFRENNNSNLEFALIREIEKYLKQYPKASYYDVVGTVPQRATIRLFVGPNDASTNKNTLFLLETFLKPDLIFHVRKMHYLEPGLTELTKEHYFSIGPSVHARWTRLLTPIRLPLKNPKALEPLMNEMINATGKESIRVFSVLIRTPGKPDQQKYVEANDLFNAKKTGPNSRLLAFSPYTEINNITALLFDIIRFDSDWTGARKLEF